jgi:hypothetical protein
MQWRIREECPNLLSGVNCTPIGVRIEYAIKRCTKLVEGAFREPILRYASISRKVLSDALLHDSHVRCTCVMNLNAEKELLEQVQKLVVRNNLR